MNTINNIIIKGLNWSGSGAVVDLLKEYNHIIQIPGGFGEIAPAGYRKSGEFNFFRDFGGIGDLISLESRLRHPSKIESYINKIDKSTSNKLVARKVIKSLFCDRTNVVEDIKTIHNLKKISKSLENLKDDFDKLVNTDQRLEASKKWIRKIVNDISEKNTKSVIFDQAINIGQHNKYWMQVFDPFKLIIVIRDPRDQFAEQLKHNYFSNSYRADIAYLFGWNQIDALNFRIQSTLNVMKNIDDLVKKNNNNILLISFEELVLNYIHSKHKIESFLSLEKSDHIFPEKYFKPMWSVNNIGIHTDKRIRIDEIDMEELVEWYNQHTTFLKTDELDNQIMSRINKGRARNC